MRRTNHLKVAIKISFSSPVRPVSRIHLDNALPRLDRSNMKDFLNGPPTDSCTYSTMSESQDMTRLPARKPTDDPHGLGIDFQT